MRVCEGDLFFSLGVRLPQPPQLPLRRDFLLGGRRRTSLVNDGVLSGGSSRSTTVARRAASFASQSTSISASVASSLAAFSSLLRAAVRAFLRRSLACCLAFSFACFSRVALLSTRLPISRSSFATSSVGPSTRSTTSRPYASSCESCRSGRSGLRHTLLPWSSYSELTHFFTRTQVSTMTGLPTPRSPDATGPSGLVVIIFSRRLYSISSVRAARAAEAAVLTPPTLGSYSGASSSAEAPFPQAPAPRA